MHSLPATQLVPSLPAINRVRKGAIKVVHKVVGKGAIKVVRKELLVH